MSQNLPQICTASALVYRKGDEGKATHREHTQGVFYPNIIIGFSNAGISIVLALDGISILLSVPKFTANLYCICLSIDLRYTKADAVQICSNFLDTQCMGELEE